MSEQEDLSFYDVALWLGNISDVSGRNEKMAMLSRYKDSEILKRVLIAGLNPYVTYGLTSSAVTPRAPTFYPTTDQITSGTIFDFLDKLSTRQFSGLAAKSQLIKIASLVTNESFQLLLNILDKDLRCGLGASTVNKVIPKLIPEFKCMLASKYDPNNIKSWPVSIQPKIDGMRCLISVTGVVDSQGYASDLSTVAQARSGHLIDSIDLIREEVEKLVGNIVETMEDFYVIDLVFDGEIVSGSFNESMKQLRRKDFQAEDAVFSIFSILSRESFDKKGKLTTNEKEHSKMLMDAVKGWGTKGCDHLNVLPVYTVSSHSEIDLYVQNFYDEGLEGAIVKSCPYDYESKRSKMWMKIKSEETVDLRVTDIFEGTGKYVQSAGGIYVDFNGVQVKVGTGLSDELRKEIWENEADIIGRLVEVKYQEITPAKSLRHPVFVRFRDDKDQAA